MDLSTMDAAGVSAIAQQGGFAVLAAVCIWAIVAIVKLGSSLMERSHLREIESMKLSTETLRVLASDRAEMMRSMMDTMLEVRTALVGLQDEIAGMRGGSTMTIKPGSR